MIHQAGGLRPFFLSIRLAGFQFSDEEIVEFLDQFDQDGDGQLDQSGKLGSVGYLLISNGVHAQVIVISYSVFNVFAILVSEALGQLICATAHNV